MEVDAWVYEDDWLGEFVSWTVEWRLISISSWGESFRTLVARGVIDGEQGGKLMLACTRNFLGSRHVVIWECGIWIVTAA